jgi:hypothetical protein
MRRQRINRIHYGRYIAAIKERRHGLDLARRAMGKPGPGAGIIAVLLNLSRDLPKNLSANLESAKQLLWKEDVALPRAAEFVLKSIRGRLSDEVPL